MIVFSTISSREAKAGDVGSDTLVVYAVTCENSKKLSLTIDEKVTKNNLHIDEKYIQLKDSSGGVIPLDLENADVSTESAIIICIEDSAEFSRLENSTLSLKKGFKASENGKALSCDVDWKVYEFEEDIGNVIYKAKIDFKQGNVSELTLYVGETMALNDTCNPDPKCIGGKWSSMNGKIVTVKNNLLTAVRLGTTKVRLYFSNGDEYFITVVVKEGGYHQSESVESSKASEASESLTESGFESESVSESEYVSESESEHESESVSARDSESEVESESNSETVSESDRESESEAETASDRESEAESETKSENDSGKESESLSDESSTDESLSEEESESERESEHDESGSESANTDESDKSIESNKSSGSDETSSSATSSTTSGTAGGSDNSGDTSLNSSKTDGRKIALPFICGGAVVALGISLAAVKGKSRKKKD